VRVVTVREFRDRASQMFHSDDIILVMREGRPAGFFLPWQEPDLPGDVRREVFLRLTEQIAAQHEVREVSEEDVLSDFAAERRSSLTRMLSSRAPCPEGQGESRSGRASVPEHEEGP
jgi:hypothetical protein